jgi:hypothetical protein
LTHPANLLRATAPLFGELAQSNGAVIDANSEIGQSSSGVIDATSEIAQSSLGVIDANSEIAQSSGGRMLVVGPLFEV